MHREVVDIFLMFLFNSWEFVVAVVVAVLLSDGDLSDVTGNMERRM